MGTVSSSLYTGHRYPAEIISHCVWLYHRFPLSSREVEKMMARGVLVTRETVRGWCQKFGQTFANELRRCRPPPGDKWHPDEVFITINGTRQYLWRAVDQDGTVVDILVTSRRDAKALKRENPDRTAAQVARILRASGGYSPSESTLLRLFHRRELLDSMPWPARFNQLGPAKAYQ